MTTLLLVFLGLAVFHFVYEGIVLPSIRLNLRFRLFELRDQIREAKIIHGDKLDDPIYNDLQDSVNNTIRMLHRINVELLVNANRAFERDAELRGVIHDRMALIKNCPIKEVGELSDQTTDVVKNALLANFGAWFIYIIPPLLVVAFFSKCLEFARWLTLLPTRDVERFLPAESFG